MIKNKESYVEHINDKNEIINMRRVLDKIEIVLEKHIVECTDFLNPYQRRLAYSILNRFFQICYFEDGGIDEAERKVIIIYPNYLEKDKIEDFIVCLEISGKLSKLEHRDFLGALLGLGITRNKIGDIFIHEQFVQIVVKREISDFIFYNLTNVGKIKVKLKIIDKKVLKEGILKYKDIAINISSLRLDVVLSSVLKLSRNKSLSIINNYKVRRNWEPIKKPFCELQEGDIISVRGYGRFMILSLLGYTKKNKVKVITRIFI